ncbi:MAG: Maf family nucleotide pyrophosphatase [Flavobacteriales bacterium]|nr:Maf family nucleotide pyrophosphatase [Flavobacteriales bacterium]
MLKKIKQYNFILGSESPRRKDILKEMGIDFDIRVSNIDETIPKGIKNHDAPVFLAIKKAHSLKEKLKANEILITADTLVFLKNKLISKPSNHKKAQEILNNLSNKTHKVITGVCICTIKKEKSFSVTTEISFNKLDKKDIAHYVKKFDPSDKAGSYGIQEWIGLIGIEKINGSYTNVVGLPSAKLYQELKKFI